jgi:hypothetical protein
MNSQTKITVIILLCLIVACAILVINKIETLPITTFLEEGKSVTYQIEKYSTHFTVQLTSTHDEMDVKITVDGQTVYEVKNIDDVNFLHNMGFSNHVIHIIIWNPTVLGLGATIEVTGVIHTYLW